MLADPMSQFVELLARSRAERIIRTINENAAIRVGSTDDGDAPRETLPQETRDAYTFYPKRG